MVEVTSVFVKQCHKKAVRFLIRHPKFPAVESKEYIGSKKSNPLVSIRKWVIHEERFEQRRGHLSQICVVPRLWAIKSALQESGVTDARWSAEALDQALVD